MRTVFCTTESLALTESTATINETHTGTLDATLPAWQFLGEGLVLDVLVETFTMRGEANPEEIVIESFTASDSMEVFFTQFVTDVFQATDAVALDEIVAVLSDTATVLDSYVASSYIYHLFRNTARVGDKATPAIIGILNETVDVSDAATFSRTLLVEDSFTAIDTPIPSKAGNVTLSSTFAASDAIVQVATGELVEGSFTIQDVIVSIANAITETISEIANVADTVVQGWNSAIATLSDTFAATDSFVATSSVYNNLVHDTFVARDLIWARDYNALAWVMNTETVGLSNYDNFGYNSITEYDGVLYATSPEGIHVLNADNDDSRAISARYKTGFTDFDTGRTKRISDIYVSYTGGALECIVETYPEEMSYTYEMEEREATAPRNNRIKPGKGLSSRYWRMEFRNIDGADFQIYDVTLNAGVSERRLN